MLKNIFDTHAHYTESCFDNDRYELITDIHDNKGVEYIMLSVSNIEDAKNALDISRKYSYVFSAAGIHPECIENTPKEYINILRNLITQNPDKIKAVGEIGLDYHYEDFKKEPMQEIFINQILLANELNLPVIIHSRDATADTLEILKNYTPKKGVVHCFSGSPETAAELLKLGLNISFTGVLTFKNAKKAIDSLKVIPIERLMLETDCPFMAPVPWRGQRCDSSMITEIAKKAAEVKNLSAQEVLDITCSNAIKFFNI